MVIQVIHAIFGLMALAGAMGVVLSRSAVHSAIHLVSAMVAIAGLFLLMGAELVAAVQIIVYAGAIVVLFLFVIMMLNLRERESPPARLRMLRIVAVLFGLCLLSQGAMIGYGLHYAYRATAVRPVAPLVEKAPAAPAAAESSVTAFQRMAGLLLSDFALPFVLTSILLLIAILGAVAVARRKPPPGEEDFYQEPSPGPVEPPASVRKEPLT